MYVGSSITKAKHRGRSSLRFKSFIANFLNVPDMEPLLLVMYNVLHIYVQVIFMIMCFPRFLQGILKKKPSSNKSFNFN